MKSDSVAKRDCFPQNDTAMLQRASQSARRAALSRRPTLNPTRLCVEQLCERLLLSGMPQAAEPAIVQQVAYGEACSVHGELVFADKAITRCFNGTITHANDAIVKDIEVKETGRLIVDMFAAGGTLDSMLWLYDENGHSLLVNNDDGATGSSASRISQRLTEGKYRVKMSASPAATGAAQQGAFSLLLGWQPTAELSVAASRIEGGKEGAAIADLNGDGYLDIAAVNDDNDLTVAYGIGDGSFEKEVKIKSFAGGASRRIVSGNFDGVGDLDLAIAFVQEKQLRLVTKATTATDGDWQISEPISLGGTPDAMAVGKLNNDELDDLFIPTHEGTHSVLYGHSSTPFLATTSHQLKDARGNVVTDVRAAVIGDFDHRNGLDIAMAVKQAGKIYVLLNREPDSTGLATFIQSDAIPVGPPNYEEPGTEGVVSGDFNGDGWIDLAAVNDKSDTVSIRLNRGNGDGEFAHSGGDFKVGVDSEVARVADFNGDRIDDLIVTNEDTHNVSLLIGTGTGAMRPRELYASGFRPTDLGVGDFNSDNNVDVAVKLDDGGLTILFGLGDGTFLVPESTAVGNDPDAIVVGDFNADAFPDVAVANLLSHEVSVLLGRGDGGFAPQTRYSLEYGLYPHAIAVRDVNNDGRLDLVTANEGSKPLKDENGNIIRDRADVSILLGLGNGQFQLHEAPVQVGDSPWAVVLEDFDGDGHVDIATANRKSNSVTVLYGKGASSLAFEREDYDIGTGRLPEKLLVDHDADGHVIALATINRITRNFTVFAFTPHTRGLGLPQVTDALPFGFAANASELPTWMKQERALPRSDESDVSPMRFMPRTVATADLNNDRYADAIMIDDRTHSTWVLLGHGDGTFAPPIQFPVSFDPEYVVANDLDADGNVDLVIGHDTDDLVITYFGRGDGTFDDGIEYKASDGPERVIVGDFGGDTRPDIAVANDDDGTLEILLQQGNRVFVKETLAVSNTHDTSFQSGAAAGHFGGDERLDLAAFDRRAAIATVNIFVGRGDGKFDLAPNQSIRLIPGSSSPTPKAEFIAAADLDHDGDDDIVAAEMTANQIWILWNDNGTFLPDVRIVGGLNPSGTADLDIRPVVIADLNNDGYPEIATVDKLFDQITILYGAATTGGDRSAAYTVDKATHVKVGRHPGTLAATDFNNDGRLDLIVGNRGSYDLSILLGSEFEADGFVDEARIGRTDDPPAFVRADFNRDGYSDRITVREIENDLTIELGRGDDSFTLASNGVHGAVVDPIIVDLDDDGQDDVVVTLNYRGEILVRFREGDESQIRYAPPLLLNPKKPARDIALLRSDNTLEIAAAELMDEPTASREQAGRVGIYRLLAGGTFNRTELATAAGAANIAAGDLDGDHRDDLVVFSTSTSDVTIFRQGSQGRFSKSGAAINVGASVADIALVNAAGGAQSGTDLVVASRAASTIFVFVGNGSGALATTPQIAARAGEESTWPYGYDPTLREVTSVHDTAAFFSGKVDGDDSLDFVAINRATNSLALMFGKHQQMLSAPFSISLRASPASATIGDANGDGRSDFVVLYADGNADVLLGDGNGAFPETKTIFVGQGATGLRLVAVDTDSFVDLIVSNRFGDVLTRLGNGDGTFRELHRADASLFLVVEDVDADGVGDYIFTNESRDRIEVRTSSSTDFTQDADDGLLAPGKAVVADLNRDGILDFAIPNYGENTVIVYLGVAPGVFGPGTSYPAGGNPSHASQADVNGDGILDLVIANSGSNDVVVLQGEGQGPTWQLRPRLRLAAGQGPVHTTIGDATADGVADIVVTNEREDRVFVLPGRGSGFFDDRPESIITFDVGLQPVQSFFSGNAIATLNRGSNTISFFANANPLSRQSFPTFGSRPVAAVLGDFDFDRRTELIVAHELDGLFSIFTVETDGFTLIRSQNFAGLSHPTDLAVWDDRGRISVFDVGDGRETAVLLFSAVPDTAFDLARTSRNVVDTTFVSFGERLLPFVVGLISQPEIGTFVTLVYEDEDGASLADDLTSVESPSKWLFYNQLPDEWSPFSEDKLDGNAPSVGDVVAVSKLPTCTIPLNPSDEELRNASAQQNHDDFFSYFFRAVTEPQDANALREATVGEGPYPTSHEAQPGDIRNDSKPSSDAENKPARLSNANNERAPISRFRPEGREHNRNSPPVPLRNHQGRVRDVNSSAAAIAFVGFSFGKLPYSRLPARAHEALSQRNAVKYLRRRLSL